MQRSSYFTKQISIKTEIIGFITFFTFLAAFIIFYSPLVLLLYGHDVTVVLDGAWRIQNNQIPHVDFPSILGYAYLMQQYLFLRLSHYNMLALAISSVTITAIIITIFLLLYKSRTFLKNSDIFLRLYIFLIIISLGLGQYNFGTPFKLLTYANLYNRYCFESLAIVILMLITLNGKTLIDKKTFIWLVVIGLFMNYLFFSKITYFGVAVLILFIFLMFRYRSINVFKYLLFITLGIFAATLLFSHESLSAIIHDYRNISGIRVGLFTKQFFMVRKFKHPFNLALILSYLCLLFMLIYKKAGYKLITLTITAGIFAALLHLTNWGETDIVFITIIPFFFILPQFAAYRYTTAARLLMIACCFFILKNILSIAYLPVVRLHQHTELKSPYVSGFYIYGIEATCNYEYSATIMAGVSLLNRYKINGEKIMSFTFENPFPVLTHTIPPVYNMLVWQYGTTYSNKVFPDAQKLFKDVDLIMVPNCDEEETSLHLRSIYKKQFNGNFSLVTANYYWSLFRKIK